jgi:acetylornithine deacetylase/succinyl-diaminopimelate desuccinylase-like protein
MLEAGVKRNVIPSLARAQLSGRPLPGIDEATFEHEVRQLIGNGVDLELTEPFRSGVAFHNQTPLFDVICSSMQAIEPNSIVAPYMQTGGTDARFLTDRDIQVYGFVPMRYEPGLDFFALCHGHDERVSVANVHFAVRVLFDIVQKLSM